jgi:hypothetical protein
VLDFGLLGSLQRATSQGQVMPAKQRIALALLLRANQVVSFDMLVQALWGDSPPPSARHTARRVLGPRRRPAFPFIALAGRTRRHQRTRPAGHPGPGSAEPGCSPRPRSRPAR